MIVNICSNDYSNFSHDNAKALRSIGIDCVDLVLMPHRFYREQSTLVRIDQMIEQVKRAEVVQIFHSEDKLYEIIKPYARRVVVYHTGTRYRENHEFLNRKFKGIKSATDQSEFSVLGNHTYIVSPVELEPAAYYQGGKYKVGHYPSHAIVKGTAEIIKMIEPFHNRMRWLHSVKPVSHHEQIKRMAGCDIYIELFKPVLNGNPYGCFGVTALEAAALGKIVLTNNLYPKVYTDAYGACPFTVVNTEEQFTNALHGLLRMNPTMFKKLQRETAEIMRENHSFEQTGNRIMKFLYE